MVIEWQRTWRRPQWRLAMRQSDLFIQPKRHGTRAGLIGPEAPLKPKHIWAFRQRSFVIQQKTGRPVPFEITEAARDAIAAWLKVRGQRDEDWLFPSRSRPGQHIGTRQDARLVDQWIRMIDLESQGTELTASAALRCLSSTRRPVTCGLAIPIGSPGTGEHCPIPRHRGGRRPGDVRADRSVTLDRA